MGKNVYVKPKNSDKWRTRDQVGGATAGHSLGGQQDVAERIKALAEKRKRALDKQNEQS